ncbi:hypothetical protein [Rubritalea tangerina]|uniref:hypothetical protein n=1 Tax=Rubritalea tangerina TaxID=430798 RepID=UPI00360C22EB
MFSMLTLSDGGVSFYVKRGQLVSLFPFYWLGVSCIEQRNLAFIRTLVEALLGLRCTIDSVSLS